MRGWAIGAVATAAVLAAGSAQATVQGTWALQKWKVMDNCAKQAQKAFPDYSAASNAKRDAALQNCLNANNLPPREPSAPPSH
jgi:hypothetical protein